MDIKVAAILSKIKTNCFLNKTMTKSKDTCERVFDGLFCWPETKSGTLEVQACTNEFIKSINKTGLATKQCMDNGTWYRKNDSLSAWTNLSQCGGIYIVDEEFTDNNETLETYKKWLPIIKYTVFVGYTLSIISLIIALAVFITFKRLQCARNKLHFHLFLSFILKGIMFILKDSLFIKGTAMSNDSTFNDNQLKYDYTWICKAFISIRYYFILSNFTFMLMEGIYLHNLIFLSLPTKNYGTSAYCSLGWVTPAFFIIPWVILRTLFENTLCWTRKDKKYISLLLDVPIATSVIVNFVLFLIIIRVLLSKIHFYSVSIHREKVKYRKLLKSTLILIPLYGMPYTISLILSFYISSSKIIEIVWLFFDQTFTSYQGLFAALVYCLLNTDVQNEIKRKYSSVKDQTDGQFRRCRTISSNTQQFAF